ncbi:LacI family transcriptional regulator [Ereboglobus sp. PH5-5]|uniref:LacI family DNA-binding transcriptional regulator n=1 Tax=unclassified Ereboglobus TaxID=2626932 RepID=UPI002406E73C|nr:MULTISPECIES: LacI family DNA-binding transcriptional regulator [unclassified Ereboglobus]MDF9827852.1 LacI family transcriptional regulator [Ereboglobus sp. PH5-10]MDF9833529.1 LacI family transcriptional regulator [Ereboglobus sp. PH5-5]
MRVTIADVAKAAGLSASGTSYALRGHPSIPPATVARVRRVAEKLGYKPDLRISSLMANVRRGRGLGKGETIALVWMNTPKDLSKLPENWHQAGKNFLLGVTRRAEQVGCAVDQFWLSDKEGMRPERLHRILVSRGISGLVFAAVKGGARVALDWDWSPFAAAVIGHTEFPLPMNRSAHFHYRSVRCLLAKLHAEGCRHPVVILNPDSQERTHSMQLAAVLTGHPDRANAAKHVVYARPDELPLMGKWQREKADSLVVGWQLSRADADALREMAPHARRVVTLEWHPRGVLPGIDPLNEKIASNALDLVVTQLQHNELGITANPATMLLEGVWVEQPDRARQGRRA